MTRTGPRVASASGDSEYFVYIASMFSFVP